MRNCLLGRLPTLAQLAADSALLASDRSGAVTGAVLDPRAGTVIDQRSVWWGQPYLRPSWQRDGSRGGVIERIEVSQTTINSGCGASRPDM